VGNQEWGMMAGFSKMYVLGGQGGFRGADGVNPIHLLVLVGDANRQWLEARYLDDTLHPLGAIRVMVPKAPNQPDNLLDALIAFAPGCFSSCPSMPEVDAQSRGLKRLDFDAKPEAVPAAWAALRQEARPVLQSLNVWQADLVPVAFPALHPEE
jgi:hypothetical protein